MLKDKSQNKINNNGTSKRKKRKINKVHSHGGGPNPHFFSKPLTHAKSSLFKPLGYSVDHDTKIKQLGYSKIKK